MSNEPSDGSHMHDGGAVDRDYDESVKDFDADVDGKIGHVAREISPPDVAIDLVTRQPLFVRKQVAPDIETHFEGTDNDFNLFTYKGHPYLPVNRDDRVFECVFIPTDIGDVHKGNKWKTYDYPEGRLVRVPLEQAWLHADERQYAWSSEYIAASLAAFINNADGTVDVDIDLLVGVAYDTFGVDIVNLAAERGGF